MTYSNMGLGQQIADFFAGPGRGQFGVDNVIWNRRIHSGRGWGAYRGASPHTDHPHIDFYKNGTPYVPHDGPAILHQGERVMSREQNLAYTSREVRGYSSREFSGAGSGSGGFDYQRLAVALAARPARTGPVMNVENQHVHSGVDMDLVLRQAAFHERQGHFG